MQLKASLRCCCCVHRPSSSLPSFLCLLQRGFGILFMLGAFIAQVIKRRYRNPTLALSEEETAIETVFHFLKLQRRFIR